MKALGSTQNLKDIRQRLRIGIAGKRGRFLLLGVSLCLIFVGIWLYLSEIRDSDARVDGRMHPVAAAIDGRVAAILVHENQIVKAGEPLVRLEDAHLGAILTEEWARLESLRLGVSPDATNAGSTGQPSASAEEAIRARMQAARAEENIARRNLEEITALHARALYELRRMDAVSSGGASSKSRAAEQQARINMDAARASLEVVSRARAAADAQLTRYRSDIVRAATMPAELRAKQLEMQEARVKEAEQKYAATTITAPTDGQVTRIGVSVGAPVRNGQIITAIMPSSPEHLWITAHISESESEKVVPGTPCSIVFPAYRDFQLNGVVDSLQNDAATPPVDASPQSLRSRTGISVRIIIPDYNAETMPALRIGMQARVRINPVF